MLYMISCLYVMGLSVKRCIAFLGHSSKSSLIPIFLLPLTLTCVAPILLIFMFLSHTENLHDATQHSLLAQWIGLIGSALLAILYVAISVRSRGRFFDIGGVIFSAIICFIFADSLYFVTNKNMGQVSSFAVYEDSGELLNCHHELYINYQKDGKSAWRCPKALAFSRDTLAPFVPWPEYIHGESKGITKTVEQLQRETLKN